jgi:hypothetical protein
MRSGRNQARAEEEIGGGGGTKMLPMGGSAGGWMSASGCGSKQPMCRPESPT